MRTAGAAAATAARLALQEFRRLLRGPGIRPATLAAVVLLPALFSGLFLWSAWDADGRLHRVPAALVDEDRPVRLADGTEVAAGRQLADQLTGRQDIGWRRVSAHQADQGLRDGRYTLALRIPADFSADLASPQTGRPRQASLRLDLDGSGGLTAPGLSRALGTGLQATADRVAYTTSARAALGRTAARGGPAEVPADPVRIIRQGGAAVDSVGAALTPLLLAAALWLFGVVVFEVVRPLDTRALASRARSWTVALGGYLLPLALGLTATAVLFALCEAKLGLNTRHLAATITLLALGTAAFTAVSHFLRAWLGLPGAVASLVLLALQLASCGGLLPAQTAPLPLRALHRVLPMGYLVDGLRTGLTGGPTVHLWRGAEVLLAYLATALVLTVLLTHRRRTWTAITLHPPLGR